MVNPILAGPEDILWSDVRPFRAISPRIPETGILFHEPIAKYMSGSSERLVTGQDFRFENSKKSALERFESSDDVTQFQVGDRVVVERTVPCGNCPECWNGNYNICNKLRHLGGSDSGGGFGEYMVAPVGNTYLLPDNVTFEAGALTEVYAVAVHALARVPVQPGDLVAVIGSGPVGLTIAQMADLAGARSVIVLGKPDQPLRIGQELMGCEVINVDTSDPVEAIYLSLIHI